MVRIAVLVSGGGTNLQALIDAQSRGELKNGRILWPVRTALSGKAVTPGGAVELCHILGREETLSRIRDGIRRLSASAGA